MFYYKLIPRHYFTRMVMSLNNAILPSVRWHGLGKAIILRDTFPGSLMTILQRGSNVFGLVMKLTYITRIQSLAY